jgi:hypothetical protein
MNRSLVAVSATLALGLGLSGPASAADPRASCEGLAASSFAGQPGAFAMERQTPSPRRRISASHREQSQASSPGPMARSMPVSSSSRQR